MKTIYSMGKGKYVTLDSYPETHETPGGNIFVVLLSLLLAAITGMALVGVDPTNINPQPNPQQNNEALRRTHG
jgi:hypothetical protein